MLKARVYIAKSTRLSLQASSLLTAVWTGHRGDAWQLPWAVIYFRSLMWFDRGSLLPRCHAATAGKFCTCLLCLQWQSIIHILILPTDQLWMSNPFKLRQVSPLHFNTCILEDYFKLYLMCTTPNKYKISLITKYSLFSTNATSSTFWWMEITSKAPRLEIENYLGLSSKDESPLRNFIKLLRCFDLLKIFFRIYD